MKVLQYFFVLMLVVACSSNDDGKQSAVEGIVVAKVDEGVVTESDIDAEFAVMPAQYQAMKDNPAMRANVLKRLLENRLLVVQADRQGVVDDPVIQSKIERARNAVIVQALVQKRQKLEPDDAGEKGVRAL